MHDAKNQRFALKIMSPEQRQNAEEVALLKQEYNIGHTLDHPKVIKTLELKLEKENLYVAMEYFPSPSLKQLIQQNVQQLWPIAGKVIRDTTDALTHFHSRGWVHRDIKPDNFLVAKDGDSRLIDFALGIKKKGFFGRLFAGKTKIQGTRSYMSPEQIRGGLVDERSDIYSYGCSVFELIGGRLPFTGSTTQDLLNKHLKAAPPPLEASNRDATPEFSALVKKMLAKEPDARPQQFAHIRDELAGMKVLKTHK